MSPEEPKCPGIRPVQNSAATQIIGIWIEGRQGIEALAHECDRVCHPDKMAPITKQSANCLKNHGRRLDVALRHFGKVLIAHEAAIFNNFSCEMCTSHSLSNTVPLRFQARYHQLE